ncbi:MAG: hypothetical protein MUC50_04225 [Myxococcota bacterium]|jgi:hypothetical protein|nr:hypothetical protein [Myxococcota bacterium]
MSTEAFGLRFCFDQLSEKIEELKKIRDEAERGALPCAEPSTPSQAQADPTAEADPTGEAEATDEVDVEAPAEVETQAKAPAKVIVKAPAEVEAEPSPTIPPGVVADPYLKGVDELTTAWENFKESMKGRISFEDVLQSALQSYDQETKSYKEELKQKAVDAINAEIDSLRCHISNLLQIHKYNR